MSKQTVILCDPHPMIHGGVKALLEQEFDVVDFVVDGRDGLKLITDSAPEIVVMEVALPSLNGFELARYLRDFQCKPKLVFYTASASPAFVREGFRSGASAFVAKTAPVGDLLKAVRAVIRGQQYISLPDSEIALTFQQKNGEPGFPFTELTPRQCEVLQLVGEGLSAKAIAAELNVVQKTVEFHKMSIMNVLKLKSSAALVRFAVESGLVGSFSNPDLKVISDLRKQTKTGQDGAANVSVELAQETNGALNTYLIQRTP